MPHWRTDGADAHPLFQAAPFKRGCFGSLSNHHTQPPDAHLPPLQAPVPDPPVINRQTGHERSASLPCNAVGPCPPTRHQAGGTHSPRCGKRPMQRQCQSGNECHRTTLNAPVRSRDVANMPRFIYGSPTARKSWNGSISDRPRPAHKAHSHATGCLTAQRQGARVR